MRNMRTRSRNVALCLEKLEVGSASNELSVAEMDLAVSKAHAKVRDLKRLADAVRELLEGGSESCLAKAQL